MSSLAIPAEIQHSAQGRVWLFIIRVAGSSLGTDVLGSFRYAADHLQDSLRLPVVLGHSGRGALMAAVDAPLDPDRYLSIATNEALRPIVDRHLISVQASARALAPIHGSRVVERSRYRGAFIETSKATNAALATYTLQAKLHNGAPRQLKTVHGAVLLDSYAARAPSHERSGPFGLREPPERLIDFVASGNLLAQSDRIAGLYM